MEAGFIALMVIAALGIGVVIGLLIAKLRHGVRMSQGFLYVLRDASPGQELFLAPTVSVQDIASQKQVVFDVDIIQPNSHE